MRKLVFCMILAILLLSVTVMAADDKLQIKEVTVYINGSRESSADETGGTINVPPESTLKLKVKVANNYPISTDGGEIKNIKVSATITAIDEEDDLDVDANDFTLLPARDKTITLEFSIPLKLETDGTYKLNLNVEGKDQNSTKFTDSVEFDVDSDKESHELRFLSKELSPENIGCSDTTRLLLRFIDTGENDETVELTIDASQIGYHKTDSFEITEDITDDANEYEFSDTIVPKNPQTGTYPVKIRATYYGGKRVIEDTLNLEVSCAKIQPVVQPTQPETVVQPVVQPVQQPVQQTPVEVVQTTTPKYPASTAVATPRTSYTQKSWLSENGLLLGIISANLIVLALGIVIVAVILKKRR